MANTVAELTQLKPAQLDIQRRIIPWSNRNRPGWKLNPGLLWLLIQHTTGNLNLSANGLMHVTFTHQGGGTSGVSFHIVVDDGLTVYQLLPFDEVGFHAGDGLDDYWRDVGGWGGVAMELCVNQFNHDPAKWERAKQVACATWASILMGDPRWDYGTGGPERFSVDRYVPHQKVSDDNKYCPTQLLNEANITRDGTGPMREAIRVLAGLTGESGGMYPDGMDIGVARMLFGRVTGDDGKSYAFNESGRVSKMWLDHGKATGEFPELVAVRIFDTRKYFKFSGGWTLLQVGSTIKEVK